MIHWVFANIYCKYIYLLLTIQFDSKLISLLKITTVVVFLAYNNLRGSQFLIFGIKTILFQQQLSETIAKGKSVPETWIREP